MIGNPRWPRILTSSLWLFVLPGAVLVALPPSLFLFPMAMWLLVLVEELLKSFAARREDVAMNRFALVTLFGIWEFVLAKPVRGLVTPELFDGLSRSQLLTLLVSAGDALLMHAVTAAIYAFALPRRPLLALFVCWAVHASFNELASAFAPAPLFSAIAAVVLGLAIATLWPLANEDRSEGAAG